MFASNVREGNETLAGFPFLPDNTIVTGVGNHVVQGWDFQVPLVPFINVPPNDGWDTHECTRRTPTTQSQMAHFFFTGQIVNTCGGPCVYANWTQNC